MGLHRNKRCFPIKKQAFGPIFLTKVEKSLSGLTQLHTFMAANLDLIGPNETISFLNRDHIVLVTIGDGEIVVTTTAGTAIRIPAAGPALDKFVDDLANHVESNFVAIATTAARD